MWLTAIGPIQRKPASWQRLAVWVLSGGPVGAGFAARRQRNRGVPARRKIGRRQRARRGSRLVGVGLVAVGEFGGDDLVQGAGAGLGLVADRDRHLAADHAGLR